MKKRHLIMLIIVLLLVLCIGAGIAYICLFTDIFKSNKTLFSKYILKNNEISKIFEDDELVKYSEKQKNTPYSIEGSIKAKVTFPDSSQVQLSNALQNCNITFNGKVDNANKYHHEIIKTNYSDSQSVEYDLYRNNDIYAFKISDVLYKYVGIENNNLKDFAIKMQIPEEITSVLPDKINIDDIENTLNVYSKDDIKSLKEKYLKIISDNLTDDMFSKEKSSEESIYTLTLTETQCKKILIKVLESLKEDDIVINKLKDNLINKYNIKEEKIDTYIADFKKSIQNIIDILYTENDINKSNFTYENIESTTNTLQDNVIDSNYINSNKVDSNTTNTLDSNIINNINSNTLNTIDANITNTTTNTINSNTVNSNIINTIDSNNINYIDSNIGNSTSINSTNSTSKEENSISIKVHSNKGQLLKTEIIFNKISFIISKSDDSVKFEIKKDNSEIVSAYTQKFKSPNETKFEFSISNKESELFNLTTGFTGLDTDEVNEFSDLIFDYYLSNSTITNAKTKFSYSLKNTKKFGDIQKEDFQNSEILLINTAPSIENLKTLYNNIQSKLVQVNNTKLQTIGLTVNQNPFIYYIPSVLTIGSTYIMQNPDKSPYVSIPLLLAGFSISMISEDNTILQEATDAKNDRDNYINSLNSDSDIINKAEEARIETDLATVKEEITLEINKKSSKQTKSKEKYKATNRALKNFKSNNEKVEYIYKDNKVTLKSKSDSSKIITGTLSSDGSFKWDN